MPKKLKTRFCAAAGLIISAVAAVTEAAACDAVLDNVTIEQTYIRDTSDATGMSLKTGPKVPITRIALSNCQSSASIKGIRLGPGSVFRYITAFQENGGISPETDIMNARNIGLALATAAGILIQIQQNPEKFGMTEADAQYNTETPYDPRIVPAGRVVRH